MDRPLSCTSCHKFHPLLRDAPERGGQCRAHPPVTMVVGAEVSRLTGARQPMFQTVYPVVLAEHYCWEHTAAAAHGIPILGARGQVQVADPAADVPGVLDEPTGPA